MAIEGLDDAARDFVIAVRVRHEGNVDALLPPSLGPQAHDRNRDEHQQERQGQADG